MKSAPLRSASTCAPKRAVVQYSMAAKKKANAKQIGGTHYQEGVSKSGQEHWDMVEDFNLDYFQGVITKYLFRHRNKGGVQDLKKAQHVLEKYIEIEEAKGN